eukprot:20397-Heterococcus_DN1.PRE.3
MSVLAAFMLLAASVFGTELPPRKLEERRQLQVDRELAETAAPSSAPPRRNVKREQSVVAEPQRQAPRSKCSPTEPTVLRLTRATLLFGLTEAQLAYLISTGARLGVRQAQSRVHNAFNLATADMTDLSTTLSHKFATNTDDWNDWHGGWNDWHGGWNDDHGWHDGGDWHHGWGRA